MAKLRSRGAKTKQMGGGKELRSLVVDDDPTIRATMRKALEGYGEVSEAKNGVEAVCLFRKALRNKNPYHLVTLDLMMPEMDGFTALECCRGLERVCSSRTKAKILILSIVADPKTVVETNKMGSDGHLRKPVDHNRLDTKIRELFRPRASASAGRRK